MWTMIVSRFQSSERLKKIEQVEILRALLGKFVAQHFTRLDSNFFNKFIWRPQRAEGEHTVLEKATGTPGSLATTLILLLKVSSYKQMGKKHILKMKSPVRVVKGKDNHWRVFSSQPFWVSNDYYQMGCR